MKNEVNLEPSNHIIYFYPFSGFDTEGLNSIVELYNSQFENSGEPFTIVLADNFGRRFIKTLLNPQPDQFKRSGCGFFHSSAFQVV